MTQRQTDPDFDPVAQDAAADTARGDADCGLEAEHTIKAPLDPEHPDFDPFRFARVSVSPELRRQLVHARLPRLDPNYLQDTLPPSRGTEDPPSSDDLFVAPLAQPRRRARALVALCLLGAALLLLLAFARPKATTAVSAGQKPAFPRALASNHAPPPDVGGADRVPALPTLSLGADAPTQIPGVSPVPAQTALRKPGNAQVVSARQAMGASPASVASIAVAPNAASAVSARPSNPDPKPSVASPTPWFDYKK